MLSAKQTRVLQSYMRSNSIQPQLREFRCQYALYSSTSPAQTISLHAELINQHYSSHPKLPSMFPESADSLPFDPVHAYVQLRDDSPQLHTKDPSPLAQLTTTALQKLVYDLTLESFSDHPLIIKSLQADLMHAPKARKQVGMQALQDGLETLASETKKGQAVLSSRKVAVRLQKQLEWLKKEKASWEKSVEEMRPNAKAFGQAFERVQGILNTQLRDEKNGKVCL